MQAVTIVLLLSLAGAIYGNILGPFGNLQIEKSVKVNPEALQEISQKGVNFQKFYKNVKFLNYGDSADQEPLTYQQEARSPPQSGEQYKQYEGFRINIKKGPQQYIQIQKHYKPEQHKQSQEDQVSSQERSSEEGYSSERQQQQQSQELHNEIDNKEQQHRRYQRHQKHQQQKSSRQDSSEEKKDQQEIGQYEDDRQMYQKINQLNANLMQLLKDDMNNQYYQQIYYPAYNGYQQSYAQQYYENPTQSLIGRQVLAELFGQEYDPQKNEINRNYLYKPIVNPQFDYQGENSMWMVISPPQQSANGYGQNELFDEAYKTMKKINPDERVKFHNSVMASSDNEEVKLNATQLLQRYNYSVEEYEVGTEDGYYLTLLRIPPKQSIKKNEAVFLMHGLFGSADDWVTAGPGRGLAYLLADAGYDVYLGNARGTKYSRRHITMSPAQTSFWKFCMDEIAARDLPAMIDFALQTSQNQQMYYVGHSLGATAMLALAAAKPQYNDKIKMMFALAPITSGTHNKSPFFKMVAEGVVSSQLGKGQFRPERGLLQTVGGQLCEDVTGCPKICSNPAFVVTGVNLEQLSADRVPVILGHADTTSTRVLNQIAQWMASGVLQKYDYGVVRNQLVYGELTPQQYQVEAVSMPVKMYVSEGDWLSQPEDVQTLQQRLSNAEMYRVSEFAHTDFVYSKNAPKIVYNKLISIIENN